MSNISINGPISFSSLQSYLGNTTGSVSMSDMYNSHITLPQVGSSLSISSFRGLTKTSLFQAFRPDTQSNSLGIYSMRLVNNNYSGPVINIKRSSDSTTNDFYSDYNGNLKTLTGTSYASWSNGTASAMIWYDQSGLGNNASATTASGGNPPKMVKDPSGSGKYVIYFPNGSATSSAYYGFTIAAQSVHSMMCSFYSLANPSTYQYILNAGSDYSVRIADNPSGLYQGNIDDFLNGGGFTMFDGSYNGTNGGLTTPYFVNTNGLWHTMCASCTNNPIASMIHIGQFDVSTYSGSEMNRSFYGYMADMFTFGASLPTISPASGTISTDYQMFYKNSHIPVWTSNGLIGSYTGESWNGTQWTDLSGAGNHVIDVSGSIASSSNGSSIPYVYGSYTTKMKFPSAILPSTYTLFHIAKYSGIHQQRILSSSNTQGNTSNWLSGFYGFSAPTTGVAYHNNWITQSTISLHGSNNWVLSTDQNSLYRSLTANRTIASPGTPSYTQLSVNNYGAEVSDWTIANIQVFNKTLNASQYMLIEDSLASRYKIPVPIQEGLVVSLDVDDWTGGAPWVDRTPNGYNFTSYGGYTYYRASDVPFSTYNTLVVFSKLTNSISDHRTLIRGIATSSDHQVLIIGGTNNLGMYDNAHGTYFIPCDINVDVSTLPMVYSSMNMWVFHLSTVAPYYTFYYNPSSYPITPMGQIATNANAAIQAGLGYIGNYANSQVWGSYGSVMWYNRKLSDLEIVDTYNRFQNKYGLTSEFDIYPSSPNPAMTSNTITNGVTASAQYQNSIAYLAFDKSTSTSWSSSGTSIATAGGSIWVQLQYSTNVRLISYSILSLNASTSTPSAWTIQGSTDGTTWTTINTQTGQNPSTSSITYTIINNFYYSYLRINFTNVVGGSSYGVSLTELIFNTKMTNPIINYDATSLAPLAKVTWSTISTWNNSGSLGSGYPATAYNSPSLGQTGDGLYHVSFNRTDSQYFSIPTLPLTWFNNSGVYAGMTIFVVAQFQGTIGSYERLIDFGNGTPSDNVIFCREGTSSGLTFDIDNGTTDTTRATAANTIDTNFHVYICQLTNSATGYTMSVYIDSTTTISGSSSSATIINNRTTTNNYIGRSPWGIDAYLNANIRQILIYNSTLSDYDRSIVYTSLKSKWNMNNPTSNPNNTLKIVDMYWYNYDAGNQGLLSANTTYQLFNNSVNVTVFNTTSAMSIVSNYITIPTTTTYNISFSTLVTSGAGILSFIIQVGGTTLTTLPLTFDSSVQVYTASTNVSLTAGQVLTFAISSNIVCRINWGGLQARAPTVTIKQS